jgi:hypothetical protein
MISKQRLEDTLFRLEQLSPERREAVLKEVDVLFRRLMMKFNVIDGGKSRKGKVRRGRD